MAPGGHVRRSSHSFACYSLADPDEVWDALTSACRTSTYLFGLTLHSTWAVDAAVTADHEGMIGLTGHVVCSRPGQRLSYVLHSSPTDPPTYLTWLIRPSAGGTTINLAIDEPATPDTIEDAEDTWLPVLEALQQHLRAQRSRHAH
jgi:hypothetical protein